jgi:hypothetical protein
MRALTVNQLLDEYASGKRNFSRTSMFGMNLEGVDLSGADFSYSDFEGTDFSGATLIETCFDESNLKLAKFVGANLYGARLCFTKCQHVDFVKAHLGKSSGFKANFYGSKFNDANLKGASLFKANLEWADFEGTNLECTDLDKTRLEGAKLKYLRIGGSKHTVTAYADQIGIGCYIRSFKWWLENYEEVGKKEKYSPEQIKEYGNKIKMIAVNWGML